MTSLIPLSLLAIALDTSRIWTYTLVTATTFVWIVSRTFHAPEPRARDSALFRWACVAVVGINMLTTVELMDLAVERYSAGMRMLLYVPVVAFVIFVLLARRAPTDAAPTA